MRFYFIYILSIILVSFSSTDVYASGNEKDSSELDVNEIIFEHTSDAYEWHIFSNDKIHISIKLPIIVYSKDKGFNVFMSSKLDDGNEYNGFRYGSSEGKYEGKVVEVRDGKEVRPFDISITKNVVGIFISCILLLLIVLSVSKWYKRNPEDVPRGFLGAVDSLITGIVDEVIKPSVGEKYRKFTPYLLTVFFFILISNLMGLIPVFPGGANITGNISVTFALAMCTFIAVNVFGNRHYWKEILWPDVPVWLKAPIPVMPLIEFFGLFTKPFALMVRLFANILAGHAIAIGLCSVIFISAKMGAAMSGGMTFISVFFMIFMDCLELMVAFIQAYVFTILSAVFIGLAQPNHKHEAVKK